MRPIRRGSGIPRIPMLHISGWYDDVLVGTTENFAISARQSESVPDDRTVGHRINTSRKIGAIDFFGPDAIVDLDAIYLRWFLNSMARSYAPRACNATRKSARPGWATTAGSRKASGRPHAHGTRVNHPSSLSKANSRFGDGKLTTKAPTAAESTDTYRADPINAFPFVTDDAFSQIGGPDDYRKVEEAEGRCPSAHLTRTPEADGCVRTAPVVHLFAASSAKDADWATKVLAVRPDGFALRLNDGIGNRARFRQGREKRCRSSPGASKNTRLTTGPPASGSASAGASASKSRPTRFPSSIATCRRAVRSARKQTGVVAEQTVYHDRSRAFPVVSRRADSLSRAGKVGRVGTGGSGGIRWVG